MPDRVAGWEGDGRRGAGGERVIYSVEGGASSPIPGLSGEEEFLQWSADGRVALRRSEPESCPLKVFRLDLATGQEGALARVHACGPVHPCVPLYYFAMTPDGKSYAYSSFNLPTELYLVTGLK